MKTLLITLALLLFGCDGSTIDKTGDSESIADAKQVKREKREKWYKKRSEKEGPTIGSKFAQEFGLPLNNPSFVNATQDEHMKDDDIVAGLTINNKSRAYPWWIIHKYHVVNDTFLFDGEMLQKEFVLLVMCDRCAGISAYNRKIDDNPETYTPFYICNLRFHDWGTFEICDHLTQSSWHPFIGESVEGPLKGKKLERISVQYTRWKEWKKIHPETTVLLGSIETRNRDHQIAKEMGPDDQSTFGTSTDTRLERYELVFGLTDTQSSRGQAYSLDFLRQQDGVVHDKVANKEAVIFTWDEYSVAGFFTELNNTKLTSFKIISEQPLRLQDDSGSIWDSTGKALSGPHANQTLKPVLGYLTKWYEYSRYLSEKTDDYESIKLNGRD